MTPARSTLANQDEPVERDRLNCREATTRPPAAKACEEACVHVFRSRKLRKSEIEGWIYLYEGST